MLTYVEHDSFQLLKDTCFLENLPRAHIPKLLQRTTSHSLQRQSKRPWTAAAGRARPTVSLRSGPARPETSKNLEATT